MVDNKLEWFPVYWQRFVIGTLEMSAEEVGAYFLMLIYQWDKGFLPANERELKKITRVSFKKLSKVLQKFEKIGDKYFNNTLEIIRYEQIEKNEKTTDRGKKGAKVRWDNYKLSIAQAMPEHSLSNGIREEENREEENRIEKKREEEKPIELQFEYMIGDQEILSVHEAFKEKYLILYNTACSQYGELNVRNWLDDFSNLHKQKTWKDYEDFRTHISRYFVVREQKDHDRTKVYPEKKGKIQSEFELNQKLHANHKSESGNS